MPCGILHWRNCKQYIERRAVFADADGLKVPDVFSPFQSVENRPFLLPTVRRDD